MQIDITNGRRFNDMPEGTVKSGSDIFLARMADGTGVKAIKAEDLQKFINGDLADLSTETKESIVAAINELVGIDADHAKSLEELKSICSVINYDNAGAHNAIYRGKYLGASLTSEQSAAIRGGSFKDLYIGDYWTINGVNYRIADFDYYLRAGDTECTTHHAVIVPDTALYNAQMNTSNVTTGAYVGSAMYTSNLASAITTIQNAFGASHILTHRDYLKNAVSNGYESGGSWYDRSVDLMTEQMVYGAPIFANRAAGSNIPASYTVGCKQLNLFRHRPDMISNRTWYWLRDVVNSSSFANVGTGGGCGSNNASVSFGVRPAFPIY